jgi:hypothetical protein
MGEVMGDAMLRMGKRDSRTLKGKVRIDNLACIGEQDNQFD